MSDEAKTHCACERPDVPYFAAVLHAARMKDFPCERCGLELDEDGYRRTLVGIEVWSVGAGKRERLW